jgi:hypothetical protein
MQDLPNIYTAAAPQRAHIHILTRDRVLVNHYVPETPTTGVDRSNKIYW